jgi:hypothetical protein
MKFMGLITTKLTCKFSTGYMVLKLEIMIFIFSLKFFLYWYLKIDNLPGWAIWMRIGSSK